MRCAPSWHRCGGAGSLGAAVENRWSVLLQSDCVEGRELSRVWTKLVGQATEAAAWLDNRGLEEVFTSRLEGVGDGSVSGGTRGRIVEAMEKTRSLLLSKSLQLHRPQKSRHVWAWRQMDKISLAWLLALQGLDTKLSSSEFSKSAASNLCLPSLECVERLGLVI